MSNSAGGGDGQLDAFALRVEDAFTDRNTARAMRNYRNCAMTYGSRSPAALGCLLELGCEAWGLPIGVAPFPGSSGAVWSLVTCDATARGVLMTQLHTTKAGALVALLELAQ